MKLYYFYDRFIIFIQFIKKQIIAIENSQNDKESTVDLMNGI